MSQSSDSQGSAQRGIEPPRDQAEPDGSADFVADPLIGTVIGDRYRIDRIIGVGGMGVVYQGHHLLMDKPVAVKMLRSETGIEKVATERFKQEAQLASRLSHTNVVAVHDYGFNAGSPYIVMDLVGGQSLAEILDQESGIAPDRAIELMMQVCSGVAHAHEYGLIHRDLKPANIMVVKSPDGKEVAKVLDFGLARVAVSEGKRQALTEPGTFLGSGLYMSPEQCRGKPADARSDVYALGCIMYEALTGLPPLIGENLLYTFQLHIEQIPASMREARPDLEIPAWLEECVNTALSKDPADRFQSAALFKEALGRNKQPSAATVIKDPAQNNEQEAVSQNARPRWLPVASATVLLFCLGLGGAVLFRQSSPPGAVGDNRHNWQQHCQDAQSAFDKGNFAEAERVLRLAVPEAKGLSNQSDVSLTMHKLADSLYAQQKYSEADKIDGDVRSSSVAKPSATDTTAQESGGDHLVQLAETCHKQGQCDVATKLLQRSIDISKKVYGPRSPQTVARLGELASLYMGLGEVDKAEPILNEVMKIKGAPQAAPSVVR